LEEEIEKVRELVLNSTEETTSKEKLRKRKPARVLGIQGNLGSKEEAKKRSRRIAPKKSLGSKGISIAY
jgi:hypothetical protein